MIEFYGDGSNEYRLERQKRVDIANVFVCEKNLLVKGTLEELEKVFAGRIVRL